MTFSTNTKKYFNGSIIVSIISLLVFPAIASADAGVPMIFLSFPIMLFALIPIIFIEAGILKKILGTTFKKSITSSSVANIVTTIIGFPLSWGLLLGLELLNIGIRGSCGLGFSNIGTSIITAIVESAWICPWENYLYWLVPVAFIINLIVAFFVSVLFEYLILKKMFKEIGKRNVKRSVWIANLVSYSFLVIFGLIYLLSLIHI